MPMVYIIRVACGSHPGGLAPSSGRRGQYRRSAPAEAGTSDIA